ncbi:WD repeat-containing protein jip5 [Endocarpon pusillum Z07020]|uniref:WD repeat-containing protein JIP5 n=1 Tax=Endocarpon pusillum (strain Z07020 / HMAS-L-300199) TaxID=1263415 RepID=U1GIM8_ENDPU|nr:WD repeat-containing protein jip5 [Endocarpon pusillum Z07020]ERF71646.1 WD repeat-containing protein jip5 [Endocarpon pusillum Z07020]
MFDTICSLPLTSDLFAQAINPSEPIVAVGLASGHVQSFKLPPAPTSAESSPRPDEAPVQPFGRRRSSTASENGLGEVETAWRTRRHKGSCRCLAYSLDGEILYSAGTDELVKAARSEDGRVIGKFAIPEVDGKPDAPTSLHILTPQTLLLGTDSSALYLYDLRDSKPVTAALKPTQTHRPHDDYISSITPLPPSSTSTSGLPKQFLTAGGTTIAVTDLRKGVVSRSEDQEDELTSSLFVSGLKAGGTSQGEKVLVGGAGGVITLWEKGVWDDQDERIVVDKLGESVDCLAKVPEGVGGLALQGQQKLVAVGLADGRVRFVRVGPNRVVQDMDVKHDDIEGVVALGFDVAGRMVSGGGQVVKVWREAPELKKSVSLNGGKRVVGSDSEEDSDGGEEDSSADEKPKSKRKKRKRGKGKDKSGGQQTMAFDLD